MATYLECVNDVLVRLREDEVNTVTANAYSKLIGKFVNDSKRQVENAWTWEALYDTINVTTSASTEEYTVTGSGRKFRVSSVIDDTNDAILEAVTLDHLDRLTQLSTSQTGGPSFYAFSGSDGTDTKVRFNPIPDGTYTIKFNLFIPQADLSSDSDIILMDKDVVVQGAYARALVERGEDGGITSNEAYQLFRSMLADLISMESTRSGDQSIWVAC